MTNTDKIRNLTFDITVAVMLVLFIAWFIYAFIDFLGAIILVLVAVGIVFALLLVLCAAAVITDAISDLIIHGFD